jgi:transcriptional regulator with XRE-family HTH domain
MHTEFMAWHHKLKNALRRQNFSHAKIGEMFGVEQPTVTKWLNGVNQPKYEVLLTLCKMGKIAPAYVLDDSQPDDGPSQIGEILAQEIARLGEREALAVLLQASAHGSDSGEMRVLRSRDETHLELPQPKSHNKRTKAPGNPTSGPTSPPVASGGPEQG